MAEERPSKKVYVSNISRDVRERDLYKLFQELGRVESVALKGRFAFVEFERSRACEDALKEYDGFNFMGTRIRVEPYRYNGGDVRYGGDPRNDRRFRDRGDRGYDRRGGDDRGYGGGDRGYGGGGGRRERRDYSKDYAVYVYGLEPNMSWQDLKDFGRTVGRSVTFANVNRMRNDECEGVIKYSDKEDYENALKELDGQRMGGKRIKVFERPQINENEEKRGRQRERSISRSRSESYSRSRSRDKKRGSKKEKRSRSRSRSMSSSESGSYSREEKKASASKENKQQNAKRSRSPSRSVSVSHSRSRTPERKLEKKKESRSRSMTPSSGAVVEMKEMKE